MKKALTTAINSRVVYLPNELSELISGKFFDGEAPSGTRDPYVTYQVISYTDISTFSEETYDVLVQFTIFSSTESSGQIKEIESALNDPELFKGQRFSFDGGTVIQMVFLQSDGPRKVTEETPDGESSYWQTDCDYQLIIEKE